MLQSAEPTVIQRLIISRTLGDLNGSELMGVFSEAAGNYQMARAVSLHKLDPHRPT
jgi:hypothetical protein